MRSIIPIALCFIILTACSDKKAEPVKDEAEMFSSAEDISTEDMETEEENKKHAAIYERFLKDEERVYMDCSADVGKHFSLKKEEGKELTLSETIKAVIDSCNSVDEFYVKFQGVEYEYIDCGKDGNEELALIIGVEGAREWTECLIIKEIGGQLKTVYANNIEESYWYSCFDINEYGYVTSNDDSLDRYIRMEYIDAEGKYHYIGTEYELSADRAKNVCYYNRIETTWLDSVVFKAEKNDVAEDADKYKNLSMRTIPLDEYLIRQFDINDTPDNANDDIYCGSMRGHLFTHYYNKCRGLNRYIHYVDVDNTKPAMFKEAYELKEYFDKKGLKLYSNEAFDENISERENEAGLTEEIKDGTNVWMQHLDFTFVINEEDQETAEVDYSLYDDLINGLKTEMRKESLESLYDFAYERGLSDELYYYVYDSSCEKAGYLLEDIDGDGIDELLFGKNDPEAPEYQKEWFDSWVDEIYDMFTIRDGKLLHVFKGWCRNRYFLCGNGIIANEGSGGAASNAHEFFRYSKGEMQLIEGVDWDNGKGTYYESEGKTYDITNSEKDYEMEFFEKYPYKKINFTPFVE